jgi:hypothetical protein
MDDNLLSVGVFERDAVCAHVTVKLLDITRFHHVLILKRGLFFEVYIA